MAARRDDGDRRRRDLRGPRGGTRRAQRRRRRAHPGDLRGRPLHHRGGRPARRARVLRRAPDLFWRFAPGHAADHDEAGLDPVGRARDAARRRQGRDRLPRDARPPARASRGDRPGRRARLLPRRHRGGGLRAGRRSRRRRELLRLGRAGHGRQLGCHHRPHPAALRRRRSLHRAREDRGRGRGRPPPPRHRAERRGRRRVTPSTTTRRRCSTTPRPPPMRGGSPVAFLARHLSTAGAA